MGNCVVELYSLDYASSYQHASVYVRQLSLHLSSSLKKCTPKSFRTVYCWQYVHCLRLWLAVLAAACSPEEEESDGGPSTATTTTVTTKKCQEEDANMRRSLVYPLVEILPLIQWIGRRWRCRQHLDESVDGSAYETLDRCVVYKLHLPRE